LSEPDYAALQAAAEAEGLRVAVGALIVDGAGRVFVHRRAPDRELYPGLWDIVGGHVEPGEGMLEALAREIEEETGWRLVGTPTLAHVADWNGRREFDFLVDVDGDLSRPRLELPQHVELRWVGREDISLLDENRDVDGGMIRRLAELALTEGPARHVTAFLRGPAAAAVEALRAEWDPAMAGQIRAHVTVAYPAELADARPSVPRVAPFHLRLGALAYAEGTVFVEVDDVDGGWAAARDVLLTADRLDVQPHVTIVHPRTTTRAPVAWAALAGRRLDVEVVVEELSVTEFDGRRWVSVVSFRV
jgi:8-oxo-dGTP diphosphatase